MDAQIRSVLEAERRVTFGLVFGSAARGTSHAGSDLDLALSLSAPMTPLEHGDLIGKLESATGKTVDLVLLDEAPPALSYRIFRDGRVIFEADRDERVRRQAWAVLEYLDFKPIEDLCVRGALEAARRG